MKKRVLIVMLVLAMLLTLPGCSKVSEVEEAIDAIGTVTMESGSRIEAAEELYNALSASEQGDVSNAVTLLAARKEYNRLVEAVDYCIACIEAIGEVTLDSKDAIDTARASYEALREDDVADYASHMYPVLVDAEDAYDDLLTQVLLRQAMAVYEEAKELKLMEKYEEAWKLLDAVVTTYPETPTAKAAKVDAAECLMILANQYYKDADYAATYDALVRTEKVYVTNDAYKELHESLFVRLAQIRPANGKIFKSRSSNGYVRFKIIAKEKDVIVKVQETKNPESYLLFYVRADEEFTVHMDEGEFILKYTYGDYWFSEKDMFGSTGKYKQIVGVADADVTYGDNVIIYDLYTEILSPNRVDGVMDLTKDQF